MNTYENYSGFGSPVASSADKEVNWWKMMYSYYLRGWLPKDLRATIIDLGCGKGYLLKALSTLGYTNVSGVDLSESQLLVAKELGVSVSRGDVFNTLETGTDKLDLIVSLDLFEHLPPENWERFLKLAYNSLRSGGRLVVQTPNPESPFASGILYGDPTHIRLISPGLLERLMLDAGYENIELRPCGPVPAGPMRTLRWFVWKILEQGLKFLSLAEGFVTPKVVTRVFLASGSKP